MFRFFLNLMLGHFRRHKLEALLCLAGVALGVAVVVGMDAAVDACVSSFAGAVDSLAERSTHSIFAEQGEIPDSVYVDLLKRRLPYPLAPVIDRNVLATTPGHVDVLARLIGVDVFSERSLRSFTKMQSSLDEAAFHRFMTEPGAVVLVDALARQLGVQTGSSVTLTIGDRRTPVHVVGIIVPSGIAKSQLTNLIVADLATAQELSGSLGSIDRIDTAVDGSKQVADLTAALPAGLMLRSTQQRATSLAQLIGSYRLNLSALSLMASFVAVFIVYNSMLISVQQRAKSLGILRSLGASRWQLGGIYFSEAIAFAAIGGVLGVLGGWALSAALVGYISTTINDLYAAVRPAAVTLSGIMWAKGLATALASCVVGAAVPLVAAARTAPVNQFRSSGDGRASIWSSLPLLVAGVLLLVGAEGVYLLPGNSPVAGFVMALMVAMGFALVCPFLTRLFCVATAMAAKPAQWLPLQLAAAEVGQALRITAVAVAATMLAMSMNIGIRTMVASFRGSLSIWLDRRFAADVFVAPELLINHKIDATLDPAVVRWVAQQPEVALLQKYRTFNISVGGEPTQITGADVALELPHVPIKGKTAGGAFDPAHDVLISEPLAGRMKLGAGDTLTLSSPTGPHRFRVFGVFYDFGNEHGQAILDRSQVIADWRDKQLNDLHVTLRPGLDRLAVAQRWNAQLRRRYPVVVNSYDQIKTQAMTVFDRTFRVTVVLTWLSGAVAFCGLAGSLLALALARRRDYSILAAVGMTGRQTAAWVLGQGVIIAWASALVAPVAGTLLAYVLAYVIQYRSFGWSIPTTAQPRFWIENFALATAAAVVAAVYPVVRLRTAPPGANLRAE